MSLFLLLALLTAAPDGATDTSCEPVDGFPEEKGVPSQPTLVRWARSRLGPDAAGIIGALDWEQLSWSGTEGRYLAPPRPPVAWNLRLAVPEPFQLTASLTLEPGACLTPRQYGADPPTADEGVLHFEGPWRVELRLSAGAKSESLLLTGVPHLAVAWRREAGRPQASLFAEQSSWPFQFDLPIAQGRPSAPGTP